MLSKHKTTLPSLFTISQPIFKTRQSSNMASFLITDVRIFDGEAIIDNGSVLVSGGKIEKVSPTRIDFDGKVISRPGHTLLPGFIDAHVHLDFGNESGLAQGLRFGVTTQCDLGNAPFQIKQLQEMVSKGDCSDLKSAMQSATPDGGWPAPLLKVRIKRQLLREMEVYADRLERRPRVSCYLLTIIHLRHQNKVKNTYENKYETERTTSRFYMSLAALST